MKICSRSFSVGDPSFSPGSGLSIQQAVQYCIGQEHIGDIRYRPYVHINGKNGATHITLLQIYRPV